MTYSGHKLLLLRSLDAVVVIFFRVTWQLRSGLLDPLEMVNH